VSDAFDPDATRVRGRVGRVLSGEHNRPSLRAIRPALFIDRDGTLIKNTGYIKRPDDVELIPHAANAVRRMNYALRPVIVVTNQSGIARGLLTEVDYERVRARVDDLFAERGGYIDAHYHCPHHPDYTGPCDCRKPRLGLFERAIHEHAIDAASSWFVGNRWSDVEPALHYGARGVLVPSDETPADEIDRARREAEVAETLTDVVHMALPG
jgi:histidinol-phosphate phosphatase family protein